MALGEFRIFQWKTKAERQKDQEEYAAWAFPYGQKQRENLEALLLAVLPKETIPSALVSYLTCKELYKKVLGKPDGDEEVVVRLAQAQMQYKQIIRKKDMSTYSALVLADAEIDELCEYPSADQIRERAQEIENKVNSKRKKQR